MTSSKEAAKKIESSIQAWREELVDLTRRNSLLNFRPGASSVIRLAEPSAGAVADLILSERSVSIMALRPEPVEPDELSEATEVSEVADPDDESGEDGDVRLSLRPGHMGFDGDPKRLRNTASNLKKRSDQEFMDRAVWTLYLALGQLKWRDVDGETFSAPLLLVPVRLGSTPDKKSWSVTRTEDDIVLNPAMLLKAPQLNVKLPPAEAEVDGFDLDAWLGKVSRACSKAQGWSVEPTALIARFSFFKEAMYRDLLDNSASIAASDLIRAVVDPVSNPLASTESVEPYEVDEVLPPEFTPLIRDADSTQRAAIATALRGNSLIIDGPPGTGKSQTIANLIGALLQERKTVLFVSEKAAALEVVRNRLNEAGLSAYLLELHSHKATRAQVAKALGEALAYVPAPPRGLSDAQRRSAEAARTALTSAAQAANVRRDDMGLSFNEAVGLLAALKDLPTPPPARVSLKQLESATMQSAKSIAARARNCWRPVTDANRFVWRGVSSETPDVGILKNFEGAVSKLAAVTEHVSVWCEKFPMPAYEWRRIADLMAESARLQPLESHWFSDAGTGDLDESSRMLSGLIERRRRCLAEAAQLSAGSMDDLLDLSFPDFESLAEGLDCWRKRTLGDVRASLAAAQRVRETIQGANQAVRRIDEALELDFPFTPAGLEKRAALVEISTSRSRARRAWLRGGALDRAREALVELQRVHEDVSTAREKAKHWAEPALSLDLEALQHRFAEVHNGLRRLSASARQDRAALKAVAAPGVRVKTLLAEFDVAIAWARSQDRLLQAEARYATDIGDDYDGPRTRWADVLAAVDNSATVKRLLGPQPSAEQLGLLSVEGDDELEPADQETILGLAEAFKVGVPHAKEFSKRLKSGTLQDSLSAVEALVERLGAVLSFSVTVPQWVADPDDERTLDQFSSLSRAVNGYRTCQEELDAATAKLTEALGARFNGFDTDIADLQETSLLLGRLRDAAGSELTQSHASTVSTAQMATATSLGTAADVYAGALAALCTQFDAAEKARLESSSCHVHEAEDLCRHLREDPDGPREWHAFKEIRVAGAEIGLAEVIDFCVDEQLACEQIEGVFAKSILTQWLEALLKSEPNLRLVSSQDRDQLVQEFQSLDRKLVAQSVADIIEKANEMRPQTSAGQAGIVRREAARMRRHMPIRELMSQAGGVIQGIKPVFMMSPLSVSQFIPSDMRFDVVIFDEASQVKPEDAINCIYRGHQLVIAGDENQLPPSSYWDGAASDSDEDSDTLDFESILDIAKTALPSRPLLWHYRSRHENLIAFSNRRFYEGRLHTFPSAQQVSPDLGVVLLRVEGTYRRAQGRDNPEEARAVAARVEHHFDTRPEMTLGVVTFSDAQRAAVEKAINELLMRRPDLQAKLESEDRLKGFFIKNLETVQGDERDVIIFAIGYGYDEAGKMSNNFGPVNKAGGWRRLNVAITRALHRVEVVSTIGAADIAESTNRGVRSLRDYLAYAEQGPGFLELDLDDSNAPTESPFEDSVKAAIESLDYVVQTQVGTAGYRIDLGIRHPERAGVFVLGVECDGYVYHSSAAARDRDRLREEVLKGLGWRLHRIWGTAWYRHRARELDRLKAVIEHAVASEDTWVGFIPEQIERPEVVLQEADESEVPPWVEQYTATPGLRYPGRHIAPGEPAAVPMLRDLVTKVVEHEGPVHISTIEQRLKDAWRFERIGARVSEQLARALTEARVESRGDSFYDVPGRPVRVRVPGVMRSASAVALDEIAWALACYADDALQISQDQLQLQVCKLFGWGARGAAIRERLEAAEAMAVEYGWIRLDGDLVSPVERLA